MSVATVEGPLPGRGHLLLDLFDLEDVGYVEEEFFVSGVARSYEQVGERRTDGRWQAATGGGAAYRTRVVVRRPIEPSRANGTVLVEWFNVSNGFDAGINWSWVHRHLVREGFVWIGVSTQRVGIEGGGGFGPQPTLGQHLKAADAERYASLDHPGDRFCFDIFTQVGTALRAPEASGLAGSIDVTTVLAAGVSQSAFHLVTYVNAVDPLVGVFDGFLLHGRGANGVPLAADGWRPASSAATAPGATTMASRWMASPGERIRDDARVPVLVLQAETDVLALGSVKARQPDSARFRLWEVAGAAHVDSYLTATAIADFGSLSIEELAGRLGTTELPGLPGTTSINTGPQQHYVAHAAIAALERWARDGVPPPEASRLDVITDTPMRFAVDAHGNAMGGIRTPWMDVPTATLSGLTTEEGFLTRLLGTTHRFPSDVIERLYPGGRDDYAARFVAARRRTQAAGFLHADDAAEIDAFAAASFPV